MEGTIRHIRPICPLVLIRKSSGMWLGDIIMLCNEEGEIETTAAWAIETVVEVTGPGL